jgi:hypothetical protein
MANVDAKGLLKTINTRIGKIGNGERTFREEMSHISRELLTYIKANGDIDAVNRLLAVLTPKNQENARKYFIAFLPYQWNRQESRFGSKSKNKDMVAKKDKLMTEFLADEANNLFSWAGRTQQPREAKPKDHAKDVAKVVDNALSDEKNGIDVKTVLKSVLKTAIADEKMKLADIFDLVNSVVAEIEEDIKAAAGDTEKAKTVTAANQQEEPAVSRKKAA